MDAYDATSRAIEVFDAIHSPVGHVTPAEAWEAVYERLTHDWANVSEQWDEAKPCVPFWCYRMLKRFADHYEQPMRAMKDVA